MHTYDEPYEKKLSEKQITEEETTEPFNKKIGERKIYVQQTCHCVFNKMSEVKTEKQGAGEKKVAIY